jgi:hypothetical protein
MRREGHTSMELALEVMSLTDSSVYNEGALEG